MNPINKNFKLIIPGYNCSKYIENCINSIKSQTYIHWQGIIIDDASTDDTYQKALDLTKDDNRFVVIKNNENKQALYNVFYGIKKICNDNDDVILLIDLDDWLYDNNVLEYLNKVYEGDSIWLTYGQYITASNKRIGCCRESDSIDFREQDWRFSHLKTFKYYLWKNLDEKDFKDEKGDFVPSPAWDHIIMFPLLEMATKKRIKFIDKILYVYNDLNPINECKKNVKFQEEMAKYGREKIRKYEELKVEPPFVLDKKQIKTTLLIRNKCNYPISLNYGGKEYCFNANEIKEMPESFRGRHSAVLEIVKEISQATYKTDKEYIEDIKYIKPEYNKKTTDFLYTFQYLNNNIENAIKRLQCSINSIKNQNVRLIVVNGSEKCIWKDIKDFADITYEHKHCKVFGSKCLLINYGVKKYVETPYFHISDIDLIYRQNHISLINYAKEVISKDDNRPHRIIFYNYNVYENMYSSNTNILLNMKKSSGGWAHGNGLIHKESFMKIRGFDEFFIGYGPEDSCFNMRIKKINIVKYISNIITAHLYHEPTNNIQNQINMDFYLKKKEFLESKLKLSINDITANLDNEKWGEY